MAIFDWTVAGSGSPIKYGRSTIMTGGGNRTYDSPDKVTTVVPPSGSCPFFDRLNDRFITPPSGWNG